MVHQGVEERRRCRRGSRRVKTTISDCGWSTGRLPPAFQCQPARKLAGTTWDSQTRRRPTARTLGLHAPSSSSFQSCRGNLQCAAQALAHQVQYSHAGARLWSSAGGFRRAGIWLVYAYFTANVEIMTSRLKDDERAEQGLCITPAVDTGGSRTSARGKTMIEKVMQVRAAAAAKAATKAGAAADAAVAKVALAGALRARTRSLWGGAGLQVPNVASQRTRILRVILICSVFRCRSRKAPSTLCIYSIVCTYLFAYIACIVIIIYCINHALAYVAYIAYVAYCKYYAYWHMLNVYAYILYYVHCTYIVKVYPAMDLHIYYTYMHSICRMLSILYILHILHILCMMYNLHILCILLKNLQYIYIYI